jgi:hypothetical protein
MTGNAVAAEAVASGKGSRSPGVVVCQRQEPIHGLLELAALARRSLKTGGDSRNEESDFAAAFAGECIGCGIRIDGEELRQLAPDCGGKVAPDSKIDRLRKGYCARRTCDSRFYRITCIAQPGVDWDALLAMKDGYVSVPEEAAKPDSRRPGERKWLLVGAATVALLVLLGIAFQYYAGGRIPFLREPEKFKVDPLPPGMEFPN